MTLQQLPTGCTVDLPRGSLLHSGTLPCEELPAGPEWDAGGESSVPGRSQEQTDFLGGSLTGVLEERLGALLQTRRRRRATPPAGQRPSAWAAAPPGTPRPQSPLCVASCPS